MFKEIELKEPELTAIELHLLHALSAGASNKHMARHMGKSEFTVRNQLSNLFKKVNVNNRTQAAGWFRDQVASAEWPELKKIAGTSVPSPCVQDDARITTQKKSS